MLTEVINNGHFVFWSAIVLMAVVPSLAYFWASIRKAEIEANLKRDMIARGMSAEDIQRVLEASGGKGE
jgi:hypothetical protein